jgi:hypothetical protein
MLECLSVEDFLGKNVRLVMGYYKVLWPYGKSYKKLVMITSVKHCHIDTSC